MATSDASKEIRTDLLGTGVSFDVSQPWLAHWLFVMRLVAGWWLLHAGLDKIYGWPFDASWFVGGAAQGTSIGPFVTLFSDGLGLTLVNISVPIGQLLIGLGLVFGAFTRTAAFFGAVLMMFFFFINGEGGGWAHGIVTGELLGIMIYGMIATLGAGRVLGIDSFLQETDLFQNHPRLQYLIG